MSFIRNWRRYCLIFNFIPIILFFFYIKEYAVNVPFMDDMEFVDTINELKKNFVQLPSLLVRQQNDHRSAVPRLGVLIAYWLKGTLDFRFSILLGYLNLILLGYAFFLVYRQSHKGYLWFLPATVLLFSPIVYQDHLWTITAYQHTLCIAFSILTLYFLQANRAAYWYYAIPISIAATLTNLDGISLLPIALFWLATQRRWKHFSIYLTFTFLYLLAYFSNFKFSSASKLPSSLDGIYLVAQSFVVMVGSIAKVLSDTHGVIFAAIIGGSILTSYVLLKVVSSASSNLLSESRKDLMDLSLTEIIFLKLLASMAMIAIGRSADGVEGMMAIRFQIYSVSMLILFYLFVIEGVRDKPLRLFRYLFFCVAIGLNIISYIKYDAAIRHFSSSLKADSYNYPAKGIFLHQYFNSPDPEPEFYKNFTFPVYFNDSIIKSWQTSNVGDGGTTSLKVAEMGNKGQYSHYLNPLLEFIVETDESESYGSEEVYLCVFQKNTAHEPFLVALMKGNGGLYERLKGKRLPKRLYGDIPDKLPAGTYQANLCWIENGVPRSTVLSTALEL